MNPLIITVAFALELIAYGVLLGLGWCALHWKKEAFKTYHSVLRIFMILAFLPWATLFNISTTAQTIAQSSDVIKEEFGFGLGSFQMAVFFVGAIVTSYFIHISRNMAKSLRDIAKSLKE